MTGAGLPLGIDKLQQQVAHPLFLVIERKMQRIHTVRKILETDTRPVLERNIMLEGQCPFLFRPIQTYKLAPEMVAQCVDLVFDASSPPPLPTKIFR